MKLLDLQFAVDNAKNIEMQERVLKHNHKYLLVVTFHNMTQRGGKTDIIRL